MILMLAGLGEDLTIYPYAIRRIIVGTTMLNLPKPKRLSLMAARAHIAKHSGKPTLHQEVAWALHSALCEGVLIAEGEYVLGALSRSNTNKTVVKEIPTEIWKQFSDSGFLMLQDRISDNRPDAPPHFPFYRNTTIATADIEGWLNINTVVKSNSLKEEARIAYIKRINALIEKNTSSSRTEDRNWATELGYKQLWIDEFRNDENIVPLSWKAQGRRPAVTKN